MKMLWSAEALTENWSLSDEERVVLTGGAARNRIGLAVQLKAYLLEGRFPTRAASISPTVVAYVAEQLGLSPGEFVDYRFDSRTGRRHRIEVLRFLDLRRASASDRTHLAEWLSTQVIPFNANVKHVTENALRWYQKRRIAPPKDAQLDRFVRIYHSAVLRDTVQVGERAAVAFNQSFHRRVGEIWVAAR